MKYRLKALGWHVFGSTALLALILGSLYLGWYQWPGWYLTDVLGLLPILLGVDVALGPLVTFLIANPNKPLRVLARDVSIIVAVQLIALGYGAITLWHGRPMYYALSGNQMEIVQASDMPADEIALGQKTNPGLAPHWYSRPRWIWAPLPDDPELAKQIVQSALTGGKDVTDMPRYFKSWRDGLPVLRTELKTVDDWGYFSRGQKESLKQQVAALGIQPDTRATLVMTGRNPPLLVVFDPGTLEVKGMMRPQYSPPPAVNSPKHSSPASTADAHARRSSYPVTTPTPSSRSD